MNLEIPLSDHHWSQVQCLFPDAPATTRGRPRRDDRQILDAILWIRQTGEKWHRLPATFPPQQTCYSRYMTWKRNGLIERIEQVLSENDSEHDRCGATLIN